MLYIVYLIYLVIPLVQEDQAVQQRRFLIDHKKQNQIILKT